jgi:hypothetical protein
LTYLRLFRIISTRADLKEFAYQLLESRLVDAIDQSSVIADANNRLVSDLALHGVRYSFLNFGVDSPDWASIGPTVDYVIKDVNVLRLAPICQALIEGQVGGVVGGQPGAADLPTSRLVLLRTCGYRTGPTNPIFIYQTSNPNRKSGQEIWGEVQRWFDLEVAHG